MFSESVVLCVRVFARVFLIASVLRSQYDEAFKMMQGVRERRQNWLCSTEVINGLCVPLICVALFMLHILMASFFFPKRNEH